MKSLFQPVKMTNCDCKEPCEDCKEEKIDLDNISSLLFNEVSKQAVQEEKPKQKIQVKPKKTNKAQNPKTLKKESPRKIECENIKYKDPVSEEYKLMWNNKMGFSLWETETRSFNF